MVVSLAIRMALRVVFGGSWVVLWVFDGFFTVFDLIFFPVFVGFFPGFGVFSGFLGLFWTFVRGSGGFFGFW